MITGKLGDLAEVTKGSLLSDEAGTAEFTGLSIDSRTIKRGSMFVAIKGEVDDGHKYLQQAYEKGAAAFVIQSGYEGQIPTDIKNRCILLPDTQLGLRQIALWWKDKFNPKYVAVTGTNGKTTTKEMIADVLAKKYNVFRSPGNYNNLFGIPLSLALLNQSCEICVLEFGMSYLGEIEELTKMVKPHLALITNIGPAHLETLGTIKNIARAKFELLDNLNSDSTRVLNLDDALLKARFDLESGPKIGYAVRADAQVRPTGYSSNSLGRIIFQYQGGEIHLKVPGLHTLYNSLAACAIAEIFEVGFEDIKNALESYKGKSSRMEILELGGITVIDDSYNANPTSMGYALKALAHIDGKGRKIAVLGDMRELGEEEIKLHHDVGSIVAEVDPDKLIAVGKLGMHIAAGANVKGYSSAKAETFMTVEEVIEAVLPEIKEGDQILVKASRAMEFEKLVTALKGKYGDKG
ncbi:MAG: UDP-N-acetylmuramoyl-tripeptide--D-alanyl-D-alanine ligase [candidate division Zixibacteria bacterium]|nr:UDP-N-acetylmuramoyl-tripeptide--D-alanyl-D-alanine ligase [candidate division Zixibacteria bacterium]